MISAFAGRAIRVLCLVAAPMAVALPASAAPVTLGGATATFCQEGWPVSASIDGDFGPINGWAIHPQEGSTQVAVYQTAADTGSGTQTELRFDLHMLYSPQVNAQHLLGRFRLAATTSARGTFGQGSECADASPGGTAVWTVLQPQIVVSASGQTLTVQPDSSILASGSLPSTDLVTVRVITPLQGITGFRLEALADGSLPFGGPGRYPSNGNFVLTELVVDARSELAVPTLSTWALALAGLLLAGVGMLWLRRKPS